MSTRTKYVVAGAGVGIVAWLLLPNWLALLIILGAVGAPVAAYLLLDPAQRRRLHRLGRKQLDR